MALIDSEKFRLKATSDSMEAEWVNVGTIKTLAFDHLEILHDAISKLKYDIQTTNMASQLLAEKFTLAELQSLYESILEKKLDKRNFRKRVKAMNILIATKETKMEGAHRPALLYKFKSKDINALKERIQVFV
jgi:8-oxo-dGTP diphosphatase